MAETLKNQNPDYAEYDDLLTYGQAAAAEEAAALQEALRQRKADDRKVAAEAELEARLDDLAEKLGSYEAARRKLGITAESYPRPYVRRVTFGAETTHPDPKQDAANRRGRPAAEQAIKPTEFEPRHPVYTSRLPDSSRSPYSKYRGQTGQ